MWDLSSLTSDRTHTRCIGSSVLITRPPRKSPVHTLDFLTQLRFEWVKTEEVPTMDCLCSLVQHGGAYDDIYRMLVRGNLNSSIYCH